MVKILCACIHAQTINKQSSRRRDLFRAVCVQAIYRSTAKGKAGVIVRALGKRYVARRRCEFRGFKFSPLVHCCCGAALHVVGGWKPG